MSWCWPKSRGRKKVKVEMEVKCSGESVIIHSLPPYPVRVTSTTRPILARPGGITGEDRDPGRI
ncbi:MAG: hypothetical protein LQ347_005999 [Umbilicaria vellea]|nr:MAG: hypothetical protein LQ347_005999 [Umbilicaria vellea]